MYVPIILGTARQGRQSENVAKYMLSQAQGASIESEIIGADMIDVRDYHLEATSRQESETKTRFSEKVSRADALIVVTPEYNHGYPGELKMMLDMLYDEYAKKPIGFCGVSAGPLGGGRAVEQLRLVAIEFRMVPIREALYFPSVHNLFDEQGNMRDPVSYQERAQKFLGELVWYAKALKAAREKNNDSLF